jgi:hypothetical protein
MQAIWQALSDYRVDVVLNVHEHTSERYKPQDGAGVATDDGIREFVVGTGGRSHYSFGSVDSNI